MAPSTLAGMHFLCDNGLCMPSLGLSARYFDKMVMLLPPSLLMPISATSMYFLFVPLGCALPYISKLYVEVIVMVQAGNK